MFSRFALAVSLAVASAAATAGTMTYVGPVVGTPGTVQITSPINYTDPMGEGRHLFDGVVIDVFCYEVRQRSNLPAQYQAAALPLNTSALVLMDILFDNYYANHRNTAVGSAALQVALWEILEDSASLNLASGAFSIGPNTDSAVRSLANSMLASLSGLTSSGKYSYTLYTSPVSQDLIQVVSRVPLPASAALMGLGLLGFSLLRNRKA